MASGRDRVSQILEDDGTENKLNRTLRVWSRAESFSQAESCRMRCASEGTFA